MLVTTKSMQDWIDIQLQKWKEVEPNINISTDSMVYMDAAAYAEVAYLLQYDMVTLINNAFLAYANWDELSNLWKDRWVVRLVSTASKWRVTFWRSTKATTNYTIDQWTLVSTQPIWLDWKVVSYYTINEAILFWSISTPPAPVYTTQTTWGLIPDWTYRYKITAITWDNVETDASPELSVTISNWLTTNVISLTWASVPNSIWYNVYIYNGSDFVFLHATVWPSYIDTVGSSIQTQTPPATNETGWTEVMIPVECTSGWGFWNTAPNTIVEFINKPVWIEYVTNTAETTGGSDEEDDETYRERISEVLSTNTWKVTISWYSQTCQAVPWVATATVTIPTWGAFRNEIEIVITSSSGSWIPDAQLLADVLATVTRDENRAPCDNITVVAPATQDIDYDITIITYDTGYSQAYLITAIQDSITNYFKSIPVWWVVYKVGIENAIHDTLGVIDYTLNSPIVNTNLPVNAMAVTWTAVITFL